MDEVFIRAFVDEIDKIARVGLGTKLILGGAGAGLATTGLAAHAGARGWRKGELEAQQEAMKRRALGIM